ncbi:microtubule-associated protein 2-like [Lineus longissimus]|uniref:microtubule-associated protein 2-like n=1 Tax=Lineus longissimus TaxID=88925 RepID=UPI00315DF8D7
MSLTTRSAPTPADSEYPYHLVYHDPNSEYRRHVNRSQPKVGSLDNVDHQPGGGNIKVANIPPRWDTTAKVGSLEKSNHEPGGGNVKIYHDYSSEYRKRTTRAQPKVGSLEKVAYVPGGGNVRVADIREKYDVTPRIEARNVGYTPRGGEKVIYHDYDAQYNKHTRRAQPMVGSLDRVNYVPGGGNTRVYKEKLQWNSLPKIGSLDNAHHRPGGGTKQVYSDRPRWASDSKIGSLDNAHHQPQGGNVKIYNDNPEWNTTSKIGSFDNINYRPGYGYIFKEKKYEKNGVDYDKGLYKRKRWWEDSMRSIPHNIRELEKRNLSR